MPEPTVANDANPNTQRSSHEPTITTTTTPLPAIAENASLGDLAQGNATRQMINSEPTGTQIPNAFSPLDIAGSAGDVPPPEDREALAQQLLHHPFFARIDDLLTHVDEDGTVVDNEKDAQGHIVPVDLADSFAEVSELYGRWQRVSYGQREGVNEAVNAIFWQSIADVLLDDRVDPITFLKNVVEPRYQLIDKYSLWEYGELPPETGIKLEEKYGINTYNTNTGPYPASPDHERKASAAISRLIPLAVFMEKKHNIGRLSLSFNEGERPTREFDLRFFLGRLYSPSARSRFGQQTDFIVDTLLSSAEAFDIPKTRIFDSVFVSDMQERLLDEYSSPFDFEAVARLTKLSDIIAPDEFVQSDQMASRLDGYLQERLETFFPLTPGEEENIGRVISFFRIAPERANQWVLPHILGTINNQGNINVIEPYLKRLNLPHTLQQYSAYLPAHLRSAIELAGVESWAKLRPWYDNNRNWVSFLESRITRGGENATILTPDDVSFMKDLNLRFYRAEQLKRGGMDFGQIVENRDYRTLVHKLSETDPAWQGQNLTLFFLGESTYGYEKMYRFVSRVGIHEAIHQWESIEDLAAKSGMSPDQFYGNILQQVARDEGIEDGRNSHQLLNAIAGSVNLDLPYVQERARDYVSSIPRLQPLLDKFNSPRAIFASWPNLKKYTELTQLLERTDLLDKLVALRKNGQHRLYDYVETLVLDVDSTKINMSRVMEFWQDPERFLAAAATHTPQEVHDRKKPSNYVEIPNLDLTAVELRDALVEGKMDGLQVFRPMEIRYTIPLNPEDIPSLREEVRRAFSMKTIEKDGVRVESTMPVAKNRKELFRKVDQRLQSAGFSINAYLDGAELPEDPELVKEIEALIYDEKIGVSRPKIKYETVIATMHKKSSPQAVIAGNDTASCDAFGDGKRTLYTFNPATAAFTIQVERSDGKRRTIAQSTMTEDKDIKTSIPKVLEKFGEEGVNIADVLPPDVLANAPTQAAADNVEVAENYKASHAGLIKIVYQDFFAEYMDRFAERQGLDPEQLVIGLGFSDAMSQLPTAPNTYAPLAPMSYSDKTHESVYLLDLQQERQPLERTVTVPESPRTAEPPLPLVRGLSYLTFEDTIPVAYIEGKAYRDTSLITYLSNMENALIAKDINNAAKGRPNMSLKYVDANGMTRGYMLAYEGKMNDEHVPSELKGTDIVFISDLARDEGSSVAGGHLIHGFTELYKTNYLDKGKLIPLYLQARDATSYRILQRQLDRVGQSLGVEFSMTEFPTYSQGDDMMHPVLITPRPLQQAA